MKYIYSIATLITTIGFGMPSVQAAVYDMDALTDGYEDTADTTSSNTNATVEQPEDTSVETNTTNQSDEPSEQAVSFAECLIYKKLEIDDAQCDRLLSSLNCPDYSKSLSACAAQQQQCLTNLSSYSNCVAQYKSCTDGVASSYPICAEQYPLRTITGEAATTFTLEDAAGDVRVYYEDNPTPADMEAVTKDRTIQTGAAIFTGDTGSVIMRLPNGVRHIILPNTYFRIADYFASDRVLSTTTQLSNGTVQVRLAVPDEIKLNYLVVTPLWTVTATGTDFDVTVNEDGTQELTVLSGAVELLSLADATTQMIAAGETVSSDQFTEENVELVELDLTDDYTLKSKLQHVWYTQRWLVIGGMMLLVALVILPVVIWLVARKRS